MRKLWKGSYKGREAETLWKESYKGREADRLKPALVQTKPEKGFYRDWIF